MEKIEVRDLKEWSAKLTAKEKVKLTDFVARAEKVRL